MLEKKFKEIKNERNVLTDANKSLTAKVQQLTIKLEGAKQINTSTEKKASKFEVYFSDRLYIFIKFPKRALIK